MNYSYDLVLLGVEFLVILVLGGVCYLLNKKYENSKAAVVVEYRKRRVLEASYELLLPSVSRVAPVFEVFMVYLNAIVEFELQEQHAAGAIDWAPTEEELIRELMGKELLVIFQVKNLLEGDKKRDLKKLKADLFAIYRWKCGTGENRNKRIINSFGRIERAADGMFS